jgi:cysteine synthase
MVTTPDVDRRVRGLRRLLGNTPLLAIDLTFRGHPRVLHAKAKRINTTGTIKDRMALYILERAYAKDDLRSGGAVVEATRATTTGITIAAIAPAAVDARPSITVVVALP